MIDKRLHLEGEDKVSLWKIKSLSGEKNTMATTKMRGAIRTLVGTLMRRHHQDDDVQSSLLFVLLSENAPAHAIVLSLLVVKVLARGIYGRKGDHLLLPLHNVIVQVLTVVHKKLALLQDVSAHTLRHS